MPARIMNLYACSASDRRLVCSGGVHSEVGQQAGLACNEDMMTMQVQHKVHYMLS